MSEKLLFVRIVRGVMIELPADQIAEFYKHTTPDMRKRLMASLKFDEQLRIEFVGEKTVSVLTWWGDNT